MINLFRRIDRCSRPSGIIAVLIGVYISSDLKTFYYISVERKAIEKTLEVIGIQTRDHCIRNQPVVTTAEMKK